MAQQGIREFDAKKMRFDWIGEKYVGYSITTPTDIENFLAQTHPETTRVVKPDQLFGKRAKYGLLGIRKKPSEVKKWIEQHKNRMFTIGEKTGELNHFLVEQFIEHTQERYLSIDITAQHDRLQVAELGGIAIEEHRDAVEILDIPVTDKITKEKITSMQLNIPGAIIDCIMKLFVFFRECGLTFLEINPLVQDLDGKVHLLDMVAKIDTCAAHLNKQTRSHVHRIRPFGEAHFDFEKRIEERDMQTGASLKCTILNQEGSIGLILGGGGASIIALDKINQMGYLDSVLNYGELSGNPTYLDNKMYIHGIIDLLCANIHTPKRLCLIGGIANFTKIDVLATAFIDALRDRIELLQQYQISILVRRGGINDAIGLRSIENFCKKHDIPCVIADANTYITDAVAKIRL